jgi:hypothetical protein
MIRLTQSPARLLLAAQVLALVLAAIPSYAQRPGRMDQAPADNTGADKAPNLAQLIAGSANDSDMRVVMRRFEQDHAVFARRYDVPLSPVRIGRERVFFDGWMKRLEELDRGTLNDAGKADHDKLREAIKEGLAGLEAQERRVAAMAPLVPFVRPLQLLQERRRDRLDVEPQASAQTLEDARKEVLRLSAALENGGAGVFPAVTAAIAADALEHLDSLRGVLESWHQYYYGFDPLFTWWVGTPYRELTEALAAYRAAI